MLVNRFFLFIVFILIELSGFAQQSKPLQFREEVFDFGNVAEDKGAAVHEFMFTNTSARPIKIISVQASCGCTTPDWSKEPVASGKTGFIQASFNPKGRPGYFNKTLTVVTDMDAVPIILQIKGQVTSESSKPDVSEFEEPNGNWKFKTSSFNMGKIYMKDSFITREFPFVNSSSKSISYLDKFLGPKYIRVDVQPKIVAAGERGVVKVSYNAKAKNQYGFQSDNIELQTNDEVNPLKSFSVYATLEDYFPVLTPAEISKSSQLRFSGYSVDFGRVRPNAASSKEVQFTNTGKKELIIKSLQTNCTCATAMPSKTNFKPGEGGSIKISFNPEDRQGTQTKAVTIYSNDPQNPVQRITFSAYIDY